LVYLKKNQKNFIPLKKMNYKTHYDNLAVKEIYTGLQNYQVDGLGYSPEGYIVEVSPQESKCWLLDVTKICSRIALKECLIAGILCSDSYVKNQEGHWIVSGDPIEGALIAAASKAKLNQSNFCQLMPRLDTIPFSAKFQYMATLHQNIEDKTIYLKGAPETVLPRAKEMLDSNGNLIQLDSELVALQAESMIADGLKVLAFAKKQVLPEKTSLERADLKNRFVFLGLQGIN
jgi:cation-transporting P-type ATPase F